jgi:hypothetical protein
MIRFKVDRETGQRMPQPGCPVYTADGAWLGEVSDVREGYIKLDAPLDRDVWIRPECIDGEFSDGVAVTFVEEDAGAFLIEAADLPLANIAIDGPVISSEVEQREQRERMERELAEQRAHLPQRRETDKGAPPDTGGIGEPVEVELARTEGLPVDEIVREAAGAQPGTFGATGARLLDGTAAGTPVCRGVMRLGAKQLGIITSGLGVLGLLLVGGWLYRMRRA